MRASQRLPKVLPRSSASTAAPAEPHQRQAGPGFAGRGRQGRAGRIRGSGGFAACGGLGAAAQRTAVARPTTLGPRPPTGPAGRLACPPAPLSAEAQLGAGSEVGRPRRGCRPRVQAAALRFSVAGETEAGRGGTRPRSLGGPGGARGAGRGPVSEFGETGREFGPHRDCRLCVLAQPFRHRGSASRRGRPGGVSSGLGRGWGARREQSSAGPRLPGVGRARGRRGLRPRPPAGAWRQVPEVQDSLHAAFHPLTRRGTRGEFRALVAVFVRFWLLCNSSSSSSTVTAIPSLCFCATFSEPDLGSQLCGPALAEAA